jgi:hypothetical protein
LLSHFDSFKEKRPEALDIYISKFNTQSLKTIYRKYLAYLRYLVFQEVREYRDMHERFERHFSILTDERHLRDVFNLYSMSFDDKNKLFDKHPGAYFREFKKAYLLLMTQDRQWCEDTLDIEQGHVLCMSLILLFGHRIKSETWMRDNPLDHRRVDHGLEYDVPPEYSLSMVLKEAYKAIYLRLLEVKLASSPVTACFMQTTSLSRSVMRLRSLRDKESSPASLV